MPIDFAVLGGGLKTKPDLFVETGTYNGDAVAAALAFGFSEVRSVELDAGRHAACCARFSGDSRVKLYHGDSLVTLSGMVAPGRGSVVYLDAHWMGAEHGLECPDEECPVLDELDVLFTEFKVRPVVVVDDCHLFRRPWPADLHDRFDQREWPLVDEIKERLPRYSFLETEHCLYCWPP